jgi:hypothetical protein
LAETFTFKWGESPSVRFQTATAEVEQYPLVVEDGRLRIEIGKMVAGRCYTVKYEGSLIIVVRREDGRLDFFEASESE